MIKPKPFRDIQSYNILGFPAILKISNYIHFQHKPEVNKKTCISWQK